MFSVDPAEVVCTLGEHAASDTQALGDDRSRFTRMQLDSDTQLHDEYRNRILPWNRVRHIQGKKGKGRVGDFREMTSTAAEFMHSQSYLCAFPHICTRPY